MSDNTSNQREYGILLHISSLPSPYGIGDLGDEAYRFVDLLGASGQQLWQILPLGPTGPDGSPYQGYSAFAGNPMLISPDKLVADGLLDAGETAALPNFPQQGIEFSPVKNFKDHLFHRAFQRFQESAPPADYQLFLEEHRYWLFDYAFFRALSHYFGGVSWHLWPSHLAWREEKALSSFQNSLEAEIKYQIFLQYIFYRQWRALKSYAQAKGVQIIGDMPIYISHQGADVWTHPHLFYLDDMGRPQLVGGVPPDDFSETGQLWGNPLYRWEQMKEDDYLWWRERIKHDLKLFNIVRLDHFRGFEAYWAVPSGEETAVHGTWVKGPGNHFFDTLKKYLGPLPLIAEDLGYITEEVISMRKNQGIPGMKVFQPACANGREELYRALLAKDVVFYPGTHDNDTILGWYQNLSVTNSSLLDLLKKIFGIDRQKMNAAEICLRFIEIAYQSCARRVIIPAQDVLCLDSRHRMNTPGTVRGNWQWRLPLEYQLAPGFAALRELR
ncbi:MAG: 4-alpha-glucanotransferase [Bacillota bacterium]|jgi:4-alpha-glucanotransferase|nr:4-alpha-glucanotransferase [Clostridia bacterium]